MSPEVEMQAHLLSRFRVLTVPLIQGSCKIKFKDLFTYTVLLAFFSTFMRLIRATQFPVLTCILVVRIQHHPQVRAPHRALRPPPLHHPVQPVRLRSMAR